MPSTVLGKRARSATDTAGASLPTSCSEAIATNPKPTERVITRSKRRAVQPEQNDENDSPRAYRPDGDEGEDGDVSLKRKRNVRTVPAKHTAFERGVEVSPAKISAHFKVGKSGIEVYQDGKVDVRTPSAARQRDALCGKVPVTPRHRILLAGSQRTPKTPIAPFSPFTAVCNQARQLFSRCSNPGKLVGREAERQELSTFVDRCLASKSAGCLYVSGPPGTGKSALVDEVCQEYKTVENIKLSVVNCMSVRNAKDLAQKLADDLGLRGDAGFGHLQSCFVRSNARDNDKYVVVLDEIDHLVDMDLELLYSLFSWSMQPSSKLVLVGIANALDLTDRCLPRLKTRGLKPELLPFMPYTATQIVEVLSLKLRSLAPDNTSSLPFMQPAALQFCARKVAAQTGDLRKAFDICRRAIDLVEQETRERDATAALQDSPSKTPLMENINLSSPTSARARITGDGKGRQAIVYTLDTVPKATIAHVAKVTAQVFGNGTAQRLGTLNLQQKAVLCALAALEKRKRDTQVERTMFATPSKHSNSAPSVKQLFEAYSNLCKREKLLHPLSSGEFRDVVSGLETVSLLSGVDGKSGSFAMPVTPSRTPSRKGKGGFGIAPMGDERRVASMVGMKELEASLDGAGGELLKDIMDGGALL
ncbi:AAA ATPase [Teratosphaeriaceae sp. CCFEE 6253]|nr:AAA ATPase [Teratosphaeriaceae sp. CCFEE 6253]